ncbi:hypothetical protein LTR62_005495 [Meristemomyces frigidus]|uniref:Uncharacterized protein n=1 Tax=Meristemomyces frigidus TaxID=1508187 RepID=A0AAN7YQU4_9PEZI|nr:hypothetical protein LTR62_005495 [Meristemomyces frigidus]
MSSTLPPISIASVAIGFISFAFTIATFLRVLWGNFMTLGEAPHEVHSYLTNLRTELLEERANLKLMKKTWKKHNRQLASGRRNHRVDSGMELDDVTIRTMSDTVRHLIKRFKEVEKPFLESGEQGITSDTNPRKRSRRRSRSVESADDHSSPPDKAYRRSRYDDDFKDPRPPRYADERGADDDDDKYWAQRTQYATYSFKRRVKWLYKKGDAQALFESLTRVQTRRIARQVAGLTMLVHEYGCGGAEMQDAVRRIDERMARFVGVRRIEE